MGEVLFGLGLLAWLQGGLKIRWPLVREEQLGDKGFGWLNLAGFILANLFVLLPGVVVYLAWCGALAVDHFSGGFLSVRPDRLAVWARQYVREDGKTVHLIPMMHIGEPGFYQQISKSIPTNSVVLLGESRTRRNCSHKLSYQRAAATRSRRTNGRVCAGPRAVAAGGCRCRAILAEVHRVFERGHAPSLARSDAGSDR